MPEFLLRAASLGFHTEASKADPRRYHITKPGFMPCVAEVIADGHVSLLFDEGKRYPVWVSTQDWE